MSSIARPQSPAGHSGSLLARTRAFLSSLNEGDGVRTSRPSGVEARQLMTIVGATVVFIALVLSLGFVGLLAR